ncbi:hypothetical protein [Kosakonia sacchari]|uniref:Uncharacterized protein n=1 Tax=Kosakonia sacchari TaxID=1158459 RepID=A0ABZ0MY38_9ENTR|nr:hypothetical protein [Kosakonia sacchari]WOZ79937.1 hypothetical protein Q8Y70_24145 [Kosakonia sacchari]
MKNDANAEILRLIHTDIYRWKAGSLPPETARFALILLTPTVPAFFMVWFIPATMLVQWLCFAAVCIPSGLLASHFSAALPKTWGEAVDARLCEYQPQNQRAWKALQNAAGEKGKLELDDLERWYELEAMTVFPQKKELLRFLNNQPETNETESRK